jgi:methylase of polypeptide subunit release factors
MRMPLFDRLFNGDDSWKCGGLEVFYRPAFDGSGRTLAPHFIQLLRSGLPFSCTSQIFENVFEWCAGPGFLGFSLLAEGLCRKLVLADINPAAIALASKTVTKNKVSGSVSTFVSDNLRSIPPQNFDLIVANPPNYFALNPAHPFYSRYKDDLRPNDPGWKIHRDFYSSVSDFLSPGGTLLISEIAVHHHEVRTPGFSMPYDVRPRPAIEDFREMIDQAGLEFLGTFPLCVLPGGIEADLVISRKPR